MPQAARPDPRVPGIQKAGFILLFRWDHQMPTLMLLAVRLATFLTSFDGTTTRCVVALFHPNVRLGRLHDHWMLY